jgi:hypothetical protein
MVAAPVRASWRQFQVSSAAERDIVASRRYAGMSKEKARVRRNEQLPPKSKKTSVAQIMLGIPKNSCTE